MGVLVLFCFFAFLGYAFTQGRLVPERCEGWRASRYSGHGGLVFLRLSSRTNVGYDGRAYWYACYPVFVDFRSFASGLFGYGTGVVTMRRRCLYVSLCILSVVFRGFFSGFD